VRERVDIVTSTLGKALGGAAGGFTAARKPIVDLLRQRSRPYLFSNSLPPVICGAALKALELLSASTALRDRLEANTRRFRAEMAARGFRLKPGTHPICPLLLGDAKLAQDFARAMLDEGIYVIGFSYPVVPQGQARIRVQISAAHSDADLDAAIGAFERVGRRLGVL
jgi:glycine C-acetyltransferase